MIQYMAYLLRKRALRNPSSDFAGTTKKFRLRKRALSGKSRNSGYVRKRAFVIKIKEFRLRKTSFCQENLRDAD